MPKAQAVKIADSAKFFVKSDGSSVLARKGSLKPKQILGIQDYMALQA